MTDEQLCERIQSGDREAGEELVNRYEPLCHKVALRLEGSRDDLLQVARLTVYQSAMRYRPDRGAKFMTVVYAWVWQKALSASRTDKLIGPRHPQTKHRAPSVTSFWREDLEAEAAPPLYDSFDLEDLRECIAKLSPLQRAVVEKTMAGEPGRQIGAAFGKSKQWSNIVYQSALKRLREMLDEKPRRREEKAPRSSRLTCARVASEG